MQLNIDLNVDDKDHVDWSLSEEISEIYGAPPIEVKECIEKIKNFVVEYQKLYITPGGTTKINLLRDELFKNIPLDNWNNSYFLIEAFKWLSPTDSMYLFPVQAWGNKAFSQYIEHNENFFKLVWSGGLDLLMDERSFIKYLVEPQEILYGENFNEREFSFVKLELKTQMESLFKDLDWVIPQIKVNPYLYPYLSKHLKINDNILALTFSSINSDENKKALFVDLIPYQEIAKDPYVMAAFLTFFYYKVKKYESYFSYAFKALKSETQVQGIIEHLEDINVFKDFFNHKDFPQQYKENTNILLQSLKKDKDIYNILPEYIRASKAVVEIMIYKHKSEYLDPKALDYWRSDILEPKLSGPVYEYLRNKLENLGILKFVHWRRNYDFISSLEKNPFEYSVPFSKDDFEVLSSVNGSFSSIRAIELIKKFPNFYEVSNAEIKCNLFCIMEYIKNGIGLFEERFDNIHPNLFKNDELIFECINNDIGEVLLKIPEMKWSSKIFLNKYFELLDDLKESGEENAFDCLYQNLPQRIRNFMEINGVNSNFQRFFRIDQNKKSV